MKSALPGKTARLPPYQSGGRQRIAPGVSPGKASVKNVNHSAEGRSVGKAGARRAGKSREDSGSSASENCHPERSEEPYPPPALQLDSLPHAKIETEAEDVRSADGMGVFGLVEIAAHCGSCRTRSLVRSRIGTPKHAHVMTGDAKN